MSANTIPQSPPGPVERGREGGKNVREREGGREGKE
jgi:hypothetical protein